MSSHPSHHRLSQFLSSQLDRNLIPVLLVIGVAGACSHMPRQELLVHVQSPFAPSASSSAISSLPPWIRHARSSQMCTTVFGCGWTLNIA